MTAIDVAHPTVESGRARCRTSIVIIDQHRLFAHALAALIDRDGGNHVQVVATATDAPAGLELVRRLRPEVVLVDFNTWWDSDRALPSTIKRDHSPTAVIVLSAERRDELAVAGLRAACDGIVPKAASVAELTTVIDRALASGMSFGDIDVSPTLHADRSDRARHELTDRELDVLALVSSGVATAVIAKHLQVSEHTVRSHVQSILTKLNAHSRLEAVAVARRDPHLRSALAMRRGTVRVVSASTSAPGYLNRGPTTSSAPPTS